MGWILLLILLIILFDRSVLGVLLGLLTTLGQVLMFLFTTVIGIIFLLVVVALAFR